MAFVKISPQTKRQALDKVRAGMSTVEVAKMFSISPKTMKTWAEKDSNSSLASTPSSSSNAASTGGQEKLGEEKTTLDFQESPAPVEQKSAVENAWQSLKGMIGLADKKEKAAPSVLAPKLDAKRQQFVDSAAPTLALAFMALAGWMWGRIGPEYRQLAPDDKVAEKIMTPLLRIYARHASFMTDINPDVADVGASMFALIGYAHVSLGLYQEIKREKEEYEQEESNAGPVYQRNYRQFRGYRTSAENGAGDEGDRQPDVRGNSGPDAGSNGVNGGHPGAVNLSSLPPKEAAQYEALSRLSQLDYQHRARRSGRPI